MQGVGLGEGHATSFGGIAKPEVSGYIPAFLSPMMRATTSGADLQPTTGARGSSTTTVVPGQADLGGS